MTKISLFLGLLATVSNFTSTTVTTQPPSSNVMTQDEMKYVELANKERVSRGLSELTIDPLLVQVARKHSKEMSDLKYFSHTSPTMGIKTPMDRYLADAGRRPTWALVGENLFYCSIVDVTRGHIALMNSKSHRENLLEPRYKRMGVGIYVNEHGEFYVTQMFLAKID